MFQRSSRQTTVVAEQPSHGEMDVRQLLAAVRRQIWVVALCCAVCAGLGYVYLLTAVPYYTASTDVMIDPRRINTVQDAYATTGLGTNSDAIDNEVQVLQSDRVALRVVDSLGLVDDPDFMAPSPSFTAQASSFVRRSLAVALDHLGRLSSSGARANTVTELVTTMRRYVEEPEPVVEDPTLASVDREIARQRALRKLRSNLTVTRRGRTFIIRVEYTSPSPSEAAGMANAHADAYVSEQLEAGLEAAHRASDWLQSRIVEMQQRSLDADLAVERFRAANELIGTGDQPLNEQQMSALNAQRASARAETALLAARLQRVHEILESGDVGGTVAESLNHAIITNLRTRYLDASKRLGELEGRLSPGHELLAKLRGDMREYERMMLAELRRVAASHQSDYEIAKAREESLERSLGELVTVAETKNEGLVSLRELERQAAIYRGLHQTLLERYETATQQQSFEISEAKVINRAREPSSPSLPQGGIIMALALAFGSAMGAGIGAVREYRDRGFRTREQVRDELNLEVLGSLPLLAATRRGWVRSALEGSLKTVPAHLMRDASPLLRHAIDAPDSSFAETLRSAKVAADLALVDNLPKIIGVVSVLPREGKSLVAKNFASLIASQGAPTLLIDGDLRNPALTQTLAPHAEQGLIEAVVDARPLEGLLICERDSQLEFLPALRRRWLSHTGDILASGGMRAVLHQAGRDFSYIVVDLPPMGSVVDVRAAAAQFDAFLLVVVWGETPRSAVRAVLTEDETILNKCLGVIFNKVDPKEVRKYEDVAPEYCRT